MTIQTPAFRYVSYPQEVIFAPGALARLYEKVELPPGWQRLMLCTSHSQRAAGWVSRIESILQSRLVALFDQVQPHVQDDQVREALGLAEAKKVDAVIGLGGGSPIGMAKAVGFQLQLPIIAIPTTYAGSEMTAVYGITHTDEYPPRKVTVRDPSKQKQATALRDGNPATSPNVPPDCLRL